MKQKIVLKQSNGWAINEAHNPKASKTFRPQKKRLQEHTPSFFELLTKQLRIEGNFAVLK